MTFAMWPALAGGALIGVAASLLLVFGRQTAGVSGIVAGLLRPQGRGWRAAFVLGLIAGGLVLLVTSPSAFGGAPRGPGAVAAAGLLVGFGTGYAAAIVFVGAMLAGMALFRLVARPRGAPAKA